MARPVAAVTALIVVLAGCGSPDGGEAPEVAGEEPRAQDLFWETLQGLCESAHEGALLRAPAGDTQVDPEARLVVHFWECDDEEIRFPFHIDDDRSRTWVFIRHSDRLELRHDHRNPDGTEEDNTWYGASTLDEGWPHLQEFVTERNGVRVGWRVEVHPDYRYIYGTIRDEDWRHHLEFDLTREVEVPPLPWGHEVRPSARP